jgi:uncharacterized protein (UPF0335 family)
MAPRVKKDDEEAQTHGSNVPDGAKVLSFVERVESLNGDLGTEKGEFMARCKVIQGDIKEVYKEAKNAGINKKALKGIVKKRALEADIEDIAADLEGDDSDAYAALQLSLEKLGDLGAAAMKAAA